MNCKPGDFKSSVEVKLTTKTIVGWPFGEMKVGDCFVVPDGIKRQTIAVAMHRAEKSGSGMFVSRSIEGSVRVWRFA